MMRCQSSDRMAPLPRNSPFRQAPVSYDIGRDAESLGNGFVSPKRFDQVGLFIRACKTGEPLCCALPFREPLAIEAGGRAASVHACFKRPIAFTRSKNRYRKRARRRDAADSPIQVTCVTDLHAVSANRLYKVDAHAAASRSSGSATPSTEATILRWDMREDGMPILRQLWTVDTGASMRLATAEVPPSASITLSAYVSGALMRWYMR